MFQAELGALVRQEQFKDYVREAERAQRKSKKAKPRRVFGNVRTALSAPFAIILFIVRAMVFRNSL